MLDYVSDTDAQDYTDILRGLTEDEGHTYFDSQASCPRSEHRASRPEIDAVVQYNNANHPRPSLDGFCETVRFQETGSKAREPYP